MQPALTLRLVGGTAYEAYGRDVASCRQRSRRCTSKASTFEQTDWPEQLSVWPSPVVALNRTVALAQVHGPKHAFLEIEHLEKDGRLAEYQHLPAIKAELLHRLGRTAEASLAYRQAFSANGGTRSSARHWPDPTLTTSNQRSGTDTSPDDQACQDIIWLDT